MRKYFMLGPTRLTDKAEDRLVHNYWHECIIDMKVKVLQVIKQAMQVMHNARRNTGYTRDQYGGTCGGGMKEIQQKKTPISEESRTTHTGKPNLPKEYHRDFPSGHICIHTNNTGLQWGLLRVLVPLRYAQTCVNASECDWFDVNRAGNLRMCQAPSANQVVLWYYEHPNMAQNE